MPAWLIDALADLNAAEAVSLAIALFAASLVPWFLLVDNRAVQQFVVHARHDVDRWSVASTEAFRDACALVLLLTTRPKGAMAR
jgi:hypothetical protein